jgi:hypothetical protein
MRFIPSVPANALRPSAAAIAATAVGLAVLTLGGPANAAVPDGAHVELLIGPSSAASNPTAAVTQGTWPDAVSGSGAFYILGAGNPKADGFGCPTGDVVRYAFTAASPNPGTAGSAERPHVTAGEPAFEVFDSVYSVQPGGTATAIAVSGSQRPIIDSTVVRKAMTDTATATAFSTPTSDLEHTGYVLIDHAWPTGATISAVAYCSTGIDSVTLADGTSYGDYAVDADANGYAITSWVQFTTVADATDSSLTSAGFAGAGGAPVLTIPTVTLADSWSGTTGTLTATVKSPDGTTALTDASGTVQFATVSGGTTTNVGDPVSVNTATGTATLTLPTMNPGDDVVYTATYTPDATAQFTYSSATSDRHDVLAPAADTTTQLTVAGSTTAGQTQTLTASVAPTTAAVGTVTFKDGSTTLGSPITVSNGTATLGKALAVGAHSLTAVFTPTNTALANTSTSAPVNVTITAKPAPTVTVTAAKGSYGKTTTATISVKNGATAATGSVTVMLDGKSLSTSALANGTATVTLAATTPAGNHTITASYAGSDSLGTATGTQTVTIAKATTKTTVTITPKKVTKAKAKKGKIKAAVTVAVPGTSAAATGTVTVKVGAKKVTGTLRGGKVTVKLPKTTGKKIAVTVSYPGNANLSGSSAKASAKVTR